MLSYAKSCNQQNPDRHGEARFLQQINYKEKEDRNSTYG